MPDQPISPQQKKIPVARVNGQPISLYQVESSLQQMLDPYKDTKGKVRLTQPQQYAARKQVIENLIMRELLYQEACRRGIEATDEELQQAHDGTTAEFHSEQHFKAVLLMQGLSPDEFRDQLRRDIIVNRLAASIVEGKRAEITTDDAREYYDEHLDEMKGPEARKVLHIEVPLAEYPSPEEEAGARSRLEPYMESAAAFEKAFEPGAAAKAGIKIDDLGYIRRGQFHPLLDSVAFRMQEGVVSRIIKTNEGLHLLLVKKILPEGKAWPFEFIQEELKKKIYEMKSVTMVNELVEELKKKAVIDIYDRVADSKLEQEQQ